MNLLVVCCHPFDVVFIDLVCFIIWHCLQIDKWMLQKCCQGQSYRSDVTSKAILKYFVPRPNYAANCAVP